MAHELAKVAEGSFQLQMKVVHHQHKSVQFDLVCLNRLAKNIQESSTVHIIAENSFLLIPTAGYMINRAGVLNS
jgi:hypothetical protein